MDWYPDNKGWQMMAGRTELRKAARFDPRCKVMHKFLVTETESGNINRQEAVSMVPPLLLDVRPEHTVLDMCASPGSKTLQILEALHAERGDGGSRDDLGLQRGFVVANDANSRRAYMLTHQCQRMCSSSLMVTCHQGQRFPFMADSASFSFDRVLCDVPCSGDGTLRKNLPAWSTWHVGDALTLHPTQVQLALRR